MAAGEGARIQSAAQSDVGRSRTENQDAFGEFTTAAGDRLFIVADGMGGHRGGATASRLCVETLGREFGESDLSSADRLQRGFALANERIHRAALADPELSGMGTTAVALLLSPDGTATLGWVGDSRVYRFRNGSLELLSSDHSIVGEMVRSGVLTPAEAEAHPRKNELLRAIGPRPEIEAETRRVDFLPGDRFLLCTDGLWGPVPDAEIGVVVGYEAPDLAVRKLIGKANERGGPDNVTVQIACVVDPAAAVQPAPNVRAAPARKGPSLPVLAGSAAGVVAVLIGLTLWGFRGDIPESSVATAEPAPTAQAAAPPQAAAPAEIASAQPQPAKPQPAVAPAAPAPKPAPAKPPAVKIAEAKRAPAKPPAQTKAVQPKPIAAKPPEPKPAAAAEPAAPPEPGEPKAVAKQETPPPPAPASSPATPAEPPRTDAAPAPEAAVVATAPPAEAPAPSQAAPADAQPAEAASAAVVPPERAAVERFFADWGDAVTNDDFALYSSLGLPGNEDTFKSQYVAKDAKLAFSLRDYEQAGPGEFMARVQMVYESSGSPRVETERKVRVRQTPTGLRYAGPD